jgi:putative redox protein
VASKPPTVADLVWLGDLRFAATLQRPASAKDNRASESAELVIDSAGVAGPSPVEALGLSLAGCMSIDVAHILTKGRHSFRALRSHLVADRAPDAPHRVVRATLHVVVEGDVPPKVVERAVALSRGKYCSVWHSLRPDILFTVTCDVHA